MGTVKVRSWAPGVWGLARRQHWVVRRSQLIELGMGPEAIRHRLNSGRLHRLMPGIYAVGRPGVSTRGWWMAAVLACQPDALLSHRSAAALLGIRKPQRGDIEVVVPPGLSKRRSGIHTYERTKPSVHGEATSGCSAPRRELVFDDIPVTGPAVVLIDLATCLPTGQLEAAVNEADHRGLIDPETLRSEVDLLAPRHGSRRLRLLLDQATHSLTTTLLERLFLPLARDAGLPTPETQAQLGGHRVDFYWADLGLVVETDGLRYHRTAFKQGADKRRDNAQANRGLTTLRFTHGQVRYEPDYVRSELHTAQHLITKRRKLSLSAQ
jgi:very-short-patch-repair endonuclease